jgi:putative membrane protein
MKRITQCVVVAGLVAAAAPAWAASLGTAGPSQPDLRAADDLGVIIAAVPRTDIVAAGSAALVPLMAADLPAQKISTVGADEPTSGGDASKPVDDLAFVAQATESGRKEVKAAQDALPQLKNPDLQRIAQLLVQHHGEANARLTRLAESKGWPVPGPQRPAAPESGTAGPDFDEVWTDDMISGHERSVALYRAQAEGGEDKDLRKYARETLPTIEQHLEWLRRSQK